MRDLLRLPEVRELGVTGGYDALLVLSFGGPERTEDVIPFLENVLRGKNVPRERMLEVAEHYYHFGGKSPINEQNRALIAALEQVLEERGPKLPVYWGNRNWHPLLADTDSKDAGGRSPACAGFRHIGIRIVSRVPAIQRGYRSRAGRGGNGAPEIHKLRTFHNHPGFLEAMSSRVRSALDRIPESGREGARLVFTAHSIPVGMAETSPYVSQLEEACRLVGDAIGRHGILVYQSRSGPPSQPWLGPDVGDAIRQLHSQGVADLVVAPIGFLGSHGSGLRFGHRGGRALPRIGNPHGPGGHRSRASRLHRDDPGTDPGADRGARTRA